MRKKINKLLAVCMAWVLNPYPNIGGTTKDIKEAAEYISKGQEDYSYVKRQIHIQNMKQQYLIWIDNKEKFMKMKRKLLLLLLALTIMCNSNKYVSANDTTQQQIEKALENKEELEKSDLHKVKIALKKY